MRARRGGHRHRDIIPQHALDAYIATGVHASDLRADGRALPDTPAERLEHLERLLYLLRSPRYELALARDLAALGEPGAFWEVKAGQAVLLQAYERDGREPTARVDYLIVDQGVVDGFADLFEGLWQGLSFHERDKATVRAVIEAKYDALRRAIRLGPVR